MVSMNQSVEALKNLVQSAVAHADSVRTTACLSLKGNQAELPFDQQLALPVMLEIHRQAALQKLIESLTVISERDGDKCDPYVRSTLRLALSDAPRAGEFAFLRDTLLTRATTSRAALESVNKFLSWKRGSTAPEPAVLDLEMLASNAELHYFLPMFNREQMNSTRDFLLFVTLMNGWGGSFAEDLSATNDIPSFQALRILAIRQGGQAKYNTPPAAHLGSVFVATQQHNCSALGHTTATCWRLNKCTTCGKLGRCPHRKCKLLSFHLTSQNVTLDCGSTLSATSRGRIEASPESFTPLVETELGAISGIGGTLTSSTETSLIENSQITFRVLDTPTVLPLLLGMDFLQNCVLDFQKHTLVTPHGTHPISYDPSTNLPTISFSNSPSPVPLLAPQTSFLACLHTIKTTPEVKAALLKAHKETGHGGF